ncbi:MAG: hypothetical protein AAGE76_15610 [Pseudomonadota bacterium]
MGASHTDAWQAGWRLFGSGRFTICQARRATYRAPEIFAGHIDRVLAEVRDANASIDAPEQGDAPWNGYEIAALISALDQILAGWLSAYPVKGKVLSEVTNIDTVDAQPVSGIRENPRLVEFRTHHQVTDGDDREAEFCMEIEAQ